MLSECVSSPYIGLAGSECTLSTLFFTPSLTLWHAAVNSIFVLAPGELYSLAYSMMCVILLCLPTSANRLLKQVINLDVWMTDGQEATRTLKSPD